MRLPFCWICSPVDPHCCPTFRKSWNFPETPVKATAFVTAIGVYDFFLNGEKQGNIFFAPGWTSEKRVFFHRYDLSGKIAKGKNVFSITAANGYALGDISSHHFRENGKCHFADHISVAALIRCTFSDGSEKLLSTDEDWEVFSSAILSSDFYHGELCDLNAVPHKLCNAEKDLSPKPKITAAYGGCVRPRERIPAQKLLISPKGEKIIDFGQEIAGFAEISVQGKKGDKLCLSHAEVLDKEGNFYTGNLQRAKAKTEYVLNGENLILHPHFTYQGFRYIRLDEFPQEPVCLDHFTAVALYTDMKQTCRFSCNDKRLNRLFNNILWGQKSNFMDIPTDCPQRSERLGWTGDSQVFCRTACINFDVKNFYDRWLSDMALDQSPDGAIPCVIPAVFNGNISAGWGDAATVCPWEVYLAYGDKKQLARHYPMMKKWVEYIHARALNYGEEYLWLGDMHYGDWLAADEKNELLGSTQTDLIASAFYAYSARLCAKAAHVLGKDEEAVYFDTLSKRVRLAFRKAFIKDAKLCVYKKADGDPSVPHNNVYSRPVTNDTQTAHALVLYFNLCEEEEKSIFAGKLAQLVTERGHLTTGFIGTPYLLFALSQNGYTELAYNLLLSEKNPSWLFAVTHGATTVWERWDSVNENGDFQDPDMNSFNHYAYGSVFSWIFGAAFGISVKETGAGYRKIKIAPQPDDRLPQMRISKRTPNGTLKVCWKKSGDRFDYEITIPKNTEAEICIPGRSSQIIRQAGNYRF